jgi:hypothetical protein
MVAGNDHDRHSRQVLPQAAELVERVEDGGVAGSDRMKNVSGDQDHVRMGRDDVVDYPPEGNGDIGFALIDSLGGLTIVLTEAKMEVRKVGDLHNLT